MGRCQTARTTISRMKAHLAQRKFEPRNLEEHGRRFHGINLASVPTTTRRRYPNDNHPHPNATWCWTPLCCDDWEIDSHLPDDEHVPFLYAPFATQHTPQQKGIQSTQSTQACNASSRFSFLPLHAGKHTTSCLVASGVRTNDLSKR